MNNNAEFDIVVYGASGFTGRLAAEYLVGRSGVRWAMAGRNLTKLAAVRDEIGATADVQLIEADAGDRASTAAMAARAKVVLTTVGPYQLYGSELVAACAAQGVDYVDLCGEPVWMRAMIDAHDSAARASGARIVFSCGFDSIPFELGVYFLQRAAIAKFGKPAPRVKGRVRKMRGTFSGGTAASSKATMAAAARDPAVAALLKNPFALTPGFEGPKQPSGGRPDFDPDLDGWVAPFLMAVINTRNVHRSNLLLNHLYGRDFLYDEMVFAGKGEKGEATAKAIATMGAEMGKDDGPKPGEGPSKAERDAGFYDVLFIGLMEDGQQIRASVRGDKDPGYGSTSKMIGESALCLIDDCRDQRGGVWTPGAAMGEKLIARLVANAGLAFAIEG